MYMIKKIGISLAVIHFLGVVVLGYLIANSPDGEAVMAWLLFISIDFPVSLGMQPVGHLVYSFDFNALDNQGNYSIYRDIDNFWFPALYCGIFGTIWWYYLPQILRGAVRWFWSK